MSRGSAASIFETLDVYLQCGAFFKRAPCGIVRAVVYITLRPVLNKLPVLRGELAWAWIHSEVCDEKCTHGCKRVHFTIKAECLNCWPALPVSVFHNSSIKHHCQIKYCLSNYNFDKSNFSFSLICQNKSQNAVSPVWFNIHLLFCFKYILFKSVIFRYTMVCETLFTHDIKSLWMEDSNATTEISLSVQSHTVQSVNFLVTAQDIQQNQQTHHLAHV